VTPNDEPHEKRRGWLKHRNPPGDWTIAPRCGAGLGPIPRAVVQRCGNGDGAASMGGSAPDPEPQRALSGVGVLDGSTVGARVKPKPHVRLHSSTGGACGLC